MLRFRHLALLAGLAICGLFCNFSKVYAQTPGQERGQIPTGPYRIAGTVVNARGGNPLARTRVTIMDAKVRQNIQFVVTSDDGRFEFHVPAGKFALQGAKRGFITAAYNQHDQFSTAIVTGADIDAENLTFRLSPNAVLTGRVLDEFGEPLRSAQIIVYRENRFSGISRISRFRGATTDDHGEYEVTPLDEGTYFVSAKATPWSRFLQRLLPKVQPIHLSKSIRLSMSRIRSLITVTPPRPIQQHQSLSAAAIASK